MGRSPGRSPEDTRRMLLDAAARVVGKRGVAVSLDVIAREAGVSKGGLVYHFASKEGLLLALAEDQFDAFREEVRARLAEPEGTPGRLLRAYVRASLEPAEDEVERERFVLITQLATVPAVVDLAVADERRWAGELAKDGVPDRARVLVVAAADGASGSLLWMPTLSDERRGHLRADLLALIDAAVAA